jgi:hypothetical protein
LSGNRLLKKSGAVAAILLCIGVAIVPCLTSSVVKASTESNSVEVTTQVCGVKGHRPYTVSLTTLQYEKLTHYLDELMERLNATTSQDDVVMLFHEAAAEINNYGLLPRGMTIRQAQMLVSGYPQNSKTSSVFENYILNRWNKKQPINANPSLKNALCVLFAAATKIPGYYPNPVIIPFGILLVLGLFPALIVSIFGQAELANRLAELGLSLWMSNPLRWFNYVVFEGYDIEFRSVGLKGLVHETLHTSGGFRGFTGLMLSPFIDKTYFLGFAFSIYGPS